jgi:3-oxoacyl-[acyl-carrier-protein] synthase I
VKIFIGSEYIISPLGTGAGSNFDMLLKNITGIKGYDNRGFNKERMYISQLPADVFPVNKFNALVENGISYILENTTGLVTDDQRTLVILSTTKGDMQCGLQHAMIAPVAALQEKYNLAHSPLVVSNACISGVLAITTAANMIGAGLYDHVIVVGIDLVTDFVLYGFQSLYATSSQPCAPFDKNRSGVTLGEGCAAVLVSNNIGTFKETPVQYLAGSSANDANHISGPSRTGEGLHRSIEKTIHASGIERETIDFVSAHGTATIFNDEMESIAFQRSQLDHKPINSFKGYYGHTLGAAGVIEVAACLQSMRNNILVKSLGYNEPGTTVELNILKENAPVPVNTVLKTASGFGGCNATILLQKT